MKILFIHQHFRTPEQGGGIRTYYLAKALVQKGHTVELITAHNAKSYLKKDIEGIMVHYLPVYYHNTLGFAGRIFSFIRFIFYTLYKALFIKADRCYAVTTPLTVGFIALLLKYIKKLPYYIEVGDLWPDAPIQMGVIKNPLLIRMLFWLEKKIYKEADTVIPYSTGIEADILRKEPKVKTKIITNFADCSFFYPERKRSYLEQKYQVSHKFVITYFGTVGKANHLEFLLDAAKTCIKQHLQEIHFIIAGDGAELPRIKQLAVSRQLNNITFIGYTNKEGVKEILNITDASYISFIDKPVMETGCPNKFFDALAAGKLVIVNMQGWIANLIEAESCGFYTDPKNPQDFTEKLIPFLNSPEKLVQYQQNSRFLAEQKFSLEQQLPGFLQLFK